ncbi:IS630 family transposase [Azospirillum soli]|uniref:IS630 family transposase n=1 Tax=Azospirillum soli TaxID=1304799 RepID=UPI003CCE93C9
MVSFAAATRHKSWSRVPAALLSDGARLNGAIARDVGLYMDPPQHALVLAVDDKSQIQALERTQPGRPLTTGQPATHTHDYTRHGTTTLFAALTVLGGTVLGQCAARHRHQEFIRFLNVVETAVSIGKVVHVILDNDATHKRPKVSVRLDKHSRWVFHFTPTSSSWLNAVEGFFAKLTTKRLRYGSFCGIVDLQVAIHRFITEHNRTAKRFVWTTDSDRIIAGVSKAKGASDFRKRTFVGR